jgi:hypothetical protein
MEMEEAVSEVKMMSPEGPLYTQAPRVIVAFGMR